MLKQLTAKVQRHLRKRGLVGTIAFIPVGMMTFVRQRSLAGTARHRAVRQRSLDFDKEYGVDTAAGLTLDALKINSENLQFGNHYEAIDPRTFQDIISNLQIEHNAYSFVDIGSGKGRALILAAQLPFKEVIGVEFAAELCRTAEVNLERFRTHPHCVCKSLKVLEADALAFSLPVGPFVLYLCNPFGEHVMRPLVERLRQSIVDNPRTVYVLYDTPRCEELWAQSNFFRPVKTTPVYSIYSSPQ